MLHHYGANGGCQLEDMWPPLRHIEKEAISSKVKSYIDELRLIPSPKAYCSFGNKPLREPIFWTGFGVENQGLDGPFDSESDLNDAVIKKCLSSEHLKGKADFFKRHLPLILGSHPPVLTHGDLQRKNILVRIMSDLDIEITFLDWEIAGWYPSYWEYARAILACGRFEDDWNCWVDRYLDPFPNEWIWMHTLMLELWERQQALFEARPQGSPSIAQDCAEAFGADKSYHCPAYFPNHCLSAVLSLFKTLNFRVHGAYDIPLSLLQKCFAV